jgi:hypothetical protein
MTSHHTTPAPAPAPARDETVSNPRAHHLGHRLYLSPLAAIKSILPATTFYAPNFASKCQDTLMEMTEPFDGDDLFVALNLLALSEGILLYRFYEPQITTLNHAVTIIKYYAIRKP